MADVFEVLGADHHEVQQMLAELEAGPHRAAQATEAQLEARGNVAENLIIESCRHEAVEQQCFWPVVRDRVPGGGELADHAISQEDEAKHVLAKLEKVGPSDPDFDDLLAKYIPAAREHIAYEENEVWAPLRHVLTAQESAHLGAKLTDAKKTAPTRPHPRTPDSPRILRPASPRTCTLGTADPLFPRPPRTWTQPLAAVGTDEPGA
jgi:hypothetical protein